MMKPHARSACRIAGRRADSVRPLRAGAQTAAPPVPEAAYVGKPIVEVRLVTEGRPTDDPASLALVETRVGQPLSMTAVRASITHLFGLGRFQDVRVEAIDAPGGVALRYDLVPLHSVQRVDFRGTAGLSEGLLRQTMTNRFGTAPPVGRAPEIARMLEQLYREHGYLRATVRPRATELHDPDRTLLEFEVDAGSQARIGSVVIDGIPAEGRDAFLREVHALPSTPVRAAGDYRRARRLRGEAAQAWAIPGGRVVPAQTLRGRNGREPHHRARDRSRGDRRVPRRSASTGQARRARADRARGLGRPGPDRRLHSAHQELPDSAGVLEGRRVSRAPGRPGHADGRVHGAPWPAVSDRRRRRGRGQPACSARAVAAGAREAPGQRRLRRVEPQRGRQRHCRDVSAARVRPRESGRRGQRAEPVSHGPGPGQAGHHHHGRPADARGRRDVRRPRHRAAGAAPRGREIGARRAVLSAAGRGRLRRGAARIPEPRVRRRRASSSCPGCRRMGRAPTSSSKFTRASRRSSTTSSSSATRAPIPRSSRASCCCRRASRSASRTSSRASAGSARSACSGASASTRSRTRAAATTDVLVTVEEAATTTFSYGGGLEVSRLLRAGEGGGAEERVEFAPRGFFDVGRRNIGGKNRSVNLYTRVSLRPKSPEPDGTERDGFGFSEYRLRRHVSRAAGLRRQRRSLAHRRWSSRASGRRSTSRAKGVNAELVHRLSPGVRASARYSFGTTRTFDEQLDPEDQARIDRIFPQVRLSGFGGAISRDTRDDVLDPTRGTFLSADGSVAARALGGQVGFMKSYIQGLWFQRVPVTPRVIFASRLAVGLADGFQRVVPVDRRAGQSDHRDRRGPARERALLRRRRHDRARLRARHASARPTRSARPDSREGATPCCS